MEHRLYRRRSSAIDFPVFDESTGELIGRLGDLSEGGFLIYGVREFHLDQELAVEVEFPDAEGTLLRAHFDVKVMWCGRDRNPVFHATGLRIFGLDQIAVAARLETLMTRFTVGNEPEDDDED